VRRASQTMGKERERETAAVQASSAAWSALLEKVGSRPGSTPMVPGARARRKRVETSGAGPKFPEARQGQSSP